MNKNGRHSESQRLSELEEIRTPQNSHIIDAAIQSGKTAGEVALGILADERESNQHAAEIAKHINEIRKTQNRL